MSEPTSSVILIKFLIIALTFGIVNAAQEDFYSKGKCPKRTEIIHPCVCINGTVNGVVIECQHVNLATLSIAFRNLPLLDATVEHVRIINGQFVRLYGPLFSKIVATYLSFENTPLQTIEDYAFYGINNTLEQLNIVNSNLSAITPLSFGILGKVSKLIIDGHSFQTLDKQLFFEQPIANSLDTIRIINGALSDLPIETFQPLHKLKVLDLHGNQLTNLKRNQFKNLRNLELLDISYNKVVKLDAQHISDLTKLGWCNASHNAIKELTRGTFARNAVLKLLNLSFNNITSLDTSSFRGMRFLRRLYLSDNQIKDIGRGTFGSVAKIGTIDLARNKLKKVEFQMFSQLNYVEIIDLAENNITIVEKNAFKDIYQAQINISHNYLEKIEPKAFINCVNITILDLSHNRLNNIKNAFDETTFATDFQLSYNAFNNLTLVSLHNMTGLKMFNISHNAIVEVPKNYFPKLYELHTIDFSHNNISRIFNGVFKTLFSLRFLDLSFNNLTSLGSPVFGPLPTLLEMDLSWNQLVTISRSALVKLTSLRILHLNHNRINKLFQIPISLNELYVSDNDMHELNNDAWPVMNSLISLDLSNNFLGDTLVSESFAGLLVLQKLGLRQNEIKQPPYDSLRGLTSLQYLYLDRNNITTLGKDAFGKLPVLFELNLYGNGLNEISKRAFEGLLQLLNLNLSSNAIKEIPTDAFFGLPSLRTLDLSYNQLLKLDNKTHGVLDDLLSLEKLNLSHNRFSFITKKTFPSNQYIPYNIKELDLSYNRIAVLTYDYTFGTKKLKWLNLSHNQIIEIRKGVLSNFTSLIELDLSYNELTDVKVEAHVFDLPKNLTRINLSNNQLFRLPFEKFNKVPQFEWIDLRNNNLSEVPLNIAWNLRNGTQVLLANNPLQCNCALRPIKHFMLQQNQINQHLQDINCEKNSLAMQLSAIPDENLECNKTERTAYIGEQYEELPDVRFRTLQIISENLELGWYVVSQNDVADFFIIIRDQQNKILIRNVVPYNERSWRLPISQLTNNTKQLINAEVCIVAKDSNFMSKRWFSTQCKRIESLTSAKNSIFFKMQTKRNAANVNFSNLNILNCLLIFIACYCLNCV